MNSLNCTNDYLNNLDQYNDCELASPKMLFTYIGVSDLIN